MTSVDYDSPNSRGFPRGASSSYDQHDHAPMDLDPEEEKVNISRKLETIDYSHGVPAAIGASRGWGGADGEQATVQSVDYHHGQGMGMVGAGAVAPPAMAGFRGGGGGYPPPASHEAYGAGFPAYPNYEGFPLGGGGGAGAGGFFPGVDAATLFAAYSEQTGQFFFSKLARYRARGYNYARPPELTLFQSKTKVYTFHHKKCLLERCRVSGVQYRSGTVSVAI